MKHPLCFLEAHFQKCLFLMIVKHLLSCFVFKELSWVSVHTIKILQLFSLSFILMNSGEIFHNFDEVFNCGFGSVATRIFDLHLFGDFEHFLAIQIQKRLNQIAIDKALQIKKNWISSNQSVQFWSWQDLAARPVEPIMIQISKR